MVKKWKIGWFCQVSKSSGLAKTILQGTVKEKKRRGRKKKGQEVNINVDRDGKGWALPAETGPAGKGL